MARKKRQYLQPEQTQEPVSSMLPSVWESGVDGRLPYCRQHGADRFLRLLRL